MNYKPKYNSNNAVKGVENFLKTRGAKKENWDIITCEYIRPILGEDTTRIQRCEEIQKDFGAFVSWYREYLKREGHE